MSVLRFFTFGTGLITTSFPLVGNVCVSISVCRMLAMGSQSSNSNCFVTRQVGSHLYTMLWQVSIDEVHLAASQFYLALCDASSQVAQVCLLQRCSTHLACLRVTRTCTTCS